MQDGIKYQRTRLLLIGNSENSSFTFCRCDDGIDKEVGMKRALDVASKEFT